MDLEGIRASVASTTSVLERLAREQAPEILETSRVLRDRVREGGRILICGNGGSAADSQHFATELTVRYRKERRAIPALALTVDTSTLTAASNDLGFGRVFARQIEAHGRAGDVLVAISTSGESENVLGAAREARRLGLTTIGLTGRSGGRLRGLVDRWIAVPSDETPRIQEGHIVVIHLLCEALEDALLEETA
jgi:D-sedoheptulose 7-phosphate isomerase